MANADRIRLPALSPRTQGRAPPTWTALPPSLPDRALRPGDEAFRFATGRRPVTEAVIAAVAKKQPGVVIRRGIRVAELISGPSVSPGIPHVGGVRTSSGEEQRADLVVDAMGRRSRGLELLTALGAREPFAQAEDCGFAYYTRYFTGPSQPGRFGAPLVLIGCLGVRVTT